MISSNPHSCSSRARPLPAGQGAGSGNLLFQSPFDQDPEPLAAAPSHAESLSKQDNSSPGTAVPENSQPGANLPSLAAEKPKAQYRHPSEVPERMEDSSAIPQQTSTDMAAHSPHLPRSPDLASLGRFGDPPEQTLGADEEPEEELQSELAENGESEGDDSDADSVQEVVIDPGMGHLIAGGFGSADSIGVSASPTPTPKKPPPGTQCCALP